ncbi:MAG: ChaN family lipoprotein [Pseudomonadota bacterium]
MRATFFGLCTALIASIGTAQDLTPEQEAALLAADIVILGEVHDNALHHVGQAALIEKLQPRAVVFEMLSPRQALQVSSYTADDLTDLGTEIGWEEAGWPDFAIYQPIFEALGAVRAVGAAAPRAQVRAAFQQGAAAVFEGDAAQFGLDTALPEPELSARKQMQFEAHCEAMPLEMMGGMVEAQRLRDAHFAARTLIALAAHGGPVAVITGNGHARRDWGMPVKLAAAAPDARVLSIGFVEAPAPADDPRYDITIVTAAAERGDPCDAFKQ